MRSLSCVSPLLGPCDANSSSSTRTNLCTDKPHVVVSFTMIRRDLQTGAMEPAALEQWKRPISDEGLLTEEETGGTRNESKRQATGEADNAVGR